MISVKDVQMNTAAFEDVIDTCSFLGITRESIDICEGSWPKARLLSQLVYWFRPGQSGNGRAIKFRDGLYWVYKTAAEWGAETGLSEWEVRISLNALESWGLIERRSMKASNSKGQCVKQLHLSLNKNLLAKMIKDVQATHDYPHAAPLAHLLLTPVVAPKENSSTSVVSPPFQATLSVPPNPSTEGSFLLKTSTNTGAEITSPKTDHQSLKNDQGSKEAELKVLGEEKNAEEKSVALAPSKVQALGLDALWMKKTGRVEPLSPKQRGQLHLLTRKAGSTAYDTAAWAIDHWSQFSHRAINKGAVSCPFTPNLDFLVKHFSVAFELWYDNLWGPKQDQIRAFLVKRGDWWHTVPGLQEKIGIKPGYEDTLHVLPPKAPLSYEGAWELYLKIETPEMRAKRSQVQATYVMAEFAAKEEPHNTALQASSLVAKQAFDASAAEENEALKQLGWVKAVKLAA